MSALHFWNFAGAALMFSMPRRMYALSCVLHGENWTFSKLCVMHSINSTPPLSTLSGQSCLASRWHDSCMPYISRQSWALAMMSGHSSSAHDREKSSSFMCSCKHLMDSPPCHGISLQYFVTMGAHVIRIECFMRPSLASKEPCNNTRSRQSGFKFAIWFRRQNCVCFPSVLLQCTSISDLHFAVKSGSASGWSEWTFTTRLTSFLHFASLTLS
mmetsp:Transcript_102636/g.290072  ORF Transcript_102636/g.290072 Transcript_102636/m.290072 type:complete len:214 (+) Transcript_102636:1739-2380(+)